MTWHSELINVCFDSRVQRLMVKTTQKPDLPWSAILSVIVCWEMTAISISAPPRVFTIFHLMWKRVNRRFANWKLLEAWNNLIFMQLIYPIEFEVKSDQSFFVFQVFFFQIKFTSRYGAFLRVSPSIGSIDQMNTNLFWESSRYPQLYWKRSFLHLWLLFRCHHVL